MDIKPLIAELRDRVSEELDYALEAQAQRVHARGVRGRPGRRGARRGAPGRPGPGHRVDRRDHRCRRSSRTAPRSSGTGPASCWPGSCSPARRAPGCCTPIRTRATSGCCPVDAGRARTAGGSACWTSARWTGCPGGLPATIGDCAADDAGRRGGARCYEMLRAEGFVKESIDLDPDAVLDYLLPIIEPAAGGRVHLHPRAGCAARRPGSPTPAPPPTSWASS